MEGLRAGAGWQGWEAEVFLRVLGRMGAGCWWMSGGSRGRGGIRGLGRGLCLRRWNGRGFVGFGGKGLEGGGRLGRTVLNTGWRNESFRGYADYMQTAEFAAEIDWLVGLKELDRVTVMCAEAVPWRCHRSLIGDAVLARGVAVEDIFVDKEGRSSRRAHAMTEFARVEGDQGVVSG